MSKVLYIKANPKSEQDSSTFQISETFVNKYKEQNPDDEIEVLDLYNSDIDFLHESDLPLVTPGGSEKMQKYAKQFASVDKYIIAAPMWNFSIPAILKAYIDYVVLVGITFKYGERGPEGLIKEGTKLLHITTRGGSYTGAPANAMELGDKYLRAIMGFMGIKNVETIVAEKMSMGDAGKEELATAKEKAENLAKEW